jgi:putative ABC transport system permease protein
MLADLVYALRSLRRAPAFAATAALTLALGIGANTAIFSVLYAVLLRPLPYHAPERLVRIDEGRPDRRLNVSYPNFLDWRARTRVFDDMGLCLPFGSVVSTGGGRAEVIPTASSEARLFRVLGVTPVLGREFAPDEEKPEGPAVALISYGFWQRRFGGAADAVGRSLTLDGRPTTIVGVLPAQFRLFAADVVFPLGARLRPMDADRGNHAGFFAYARLRDGVDVERAQREMSGIAAALQREHPATNTNMGAFVTPIAEFLLGSARPTLTLLSSAVAVLLVIACANVANVLLARGLHRARETAVRAALGAGRLRIVRLFLVEGFVIALLGSAGGLLVASWAVRVMQSTRGLRLPRAADIAIGAPSIAFAVALSAVTVLLFALAPSPQLSRVNLMGVLRQAGAGAGAGRSSGRLRTALVTAEVALSLTLVVGAGLMLRSIARLTAVEPGYDAERMFAVDIAQSGARYDQPAGIRQFGDRLLDEIRTIPGVSGAALAFSPGPNWTPKVTPTDSPLPHGQEAAPFTSSVTPGYFAAMGIPLVAGRRFDERDAAGAPTVAIVSESFVREVLGGGDPVGRRVTAIGIPEMASMPIVGVVRDTRRLGLARGAEPELYVPYAQMTVSYPTLLVRVTSGDPLAVSRAVDGRVAAIDAGVPTVQPRRLADDLGRSITNHRTITVLLQCFAALALSLTALGIAGVVSYVVAQRTSEIGVRIALGADASSIQGLIVRSAMLPVAAGLAIGGVATLPFTRLIRAFLYDVAPADPLALAGGAATLTLAALAAAWIPARRATRIDPLDALRAN